MVGELCHEELSQSFLREGEIILGIVTIYLSILEQHLPSPSSGEREGSIPSRSRVYPRLRAHSKALP